MTRNPSSFHHPSVSRPCVKLSHMWFLFQINVIDIDKTRQDKILIVPYKRCNSYLFRPGLINAVSKYVMDLVLLLLLRLESEVKFHAFIASFWSGPIHLETFSFNFYRLYVAYLWKKNDTVSIISEQPSYVVKCQICISFCGFYMFVNEPSLSNKIWMYLEFHNFRWSFIPLITAWFHECK